MSVYTLSSPENGIYYLAGDIEKLVSNKRARILLSSIGYSQKENRLHFASELTVDQFASSIKLVIKFVGGTLEYDQKIGGELLDYKLSEEQFSLFSEQALKIKENDCNSNDFESFANSLMLNMKARRLYPLQLLSAYHLAFSHNGCNFSVPGAGKTSIVYGAYTYLHNLPEGAEGKVDKLLIIGPLSSFGPWEQEYFECFGEIPNRKRISGGIPIEQKKDFFYGSTADLILMSYSSVASIIDALKYFLTHNKVMVVLDEAHKIKNTTGGVIATSIMALAPYCTSRVVLTGTPAPNGYDDLYNLFSFIWPRKNIIKYNPAQLRDMTKDPSDTRISQLMDNLDPFFIRIKKSDLGIPAPIENPPIIVSMKDSQRRIYDFIEKKFIEDLSDSDKDIHSAFVQARTIRLMQAATNPALLKTPLSNYASDLGITSSDFEEDNSIIKEIYQYIDNEIPAKFEACATLVENIISRGQKVIVWAIFIKNLETLHEYLLSRGINSRILYGATPIASEDKDEEDEQKSLTREAIIKEFNSTTSSFNVIIANPFAVAESISLHKACHNAIYLERSFNCAHYIQSKDRIHRYGIPPNIQTNYYYLESEDSIDSTVFERLAKKEERMLSIIESMPIPLFANVTDDGRDDIKAIIQDYAKRKSMSI